MKRWSCSNCGDGVSARECPNCGDLAPASAPVDESGPNGELEMGADGLWRPKEA